MAIDGKPVSLETSARRAAEFFYTFKQGRPDLVPTGIQAVDNVLGGMFPGSVGIVAAATGVGKSSVMTDACMVAGGGIISLEDGEDVLGSRVLAKVAEVDALKIRTKSFTPEEQLRLAEGMERLGTMDHVMVRYCIAAPLDEVETAVEQLAEAGCRMVWLDYIQKVRGVSDDRRGEVSTVFTRFQRAVFKANVAGMVISQFSRQSQQDPHKEPQIWWLKESGDLENEARVIVLFHRDKDDHNLIRGRLAKSTYGGEGLRFFYRRDENGILREGLAAEDEDF